MLKYVAALLVALSVVMPAVAEEGCPSGLLKSDLRNKCVKPTETSKLPLDDELPMRFEAIQVSLPIIFIQATGKITADTPAEFDRFLATYDATLSRELNLHSRGGNLMAGLQLGEKIRKAGYNTSIGRSVQLDEAMEVFEYSSSICASACAYAFLGGVTRSYDKKSVYGLHRFGLVGDELSGDDAQVIGGILASYVQRMGVDQAVLQVASSASFQDGLFEVPVAMAEAMRVIYDASGKTSFAVEIHNDKPIATFKIVRRDREWPAVISCVGGVPALSIIDKAGTIPEAFRSARAFPASFKDGTGRMLRASATYLRVEGGRGLLSFKIPGLQPASFDGKGLALDDISHPEIERLYALKPQPKDAFYKKALWTDQLFAFLFSVEADNGRKTLPLVLGQCGPKRN